MTLNVLKLKTENIWQNWRGMLKCWKLVKPFEKSLKNLKPSKIAKKRKTDTKKVKNSKLTLNDLKLKTENIAWNWRRVYKISRLSSIVENSNWAELFKNSKQMKNIKNSGLSRKVLSSKLNKYTKKKLTKYKNL